MAWRFGLGYKPTPLEQAGLYANIPRLRAMERIERGDLSGMDYRDVYNLYLLAYESEEIAIRARTKFLERYVEQQTSRPNGS